METLIVKKATKKDLGLLLDYAKKIGVELLVASKEKDDFEARWENGLTIEDAKAKSLKKIREWWKK